MRPELLGPGIASLGAFWAPRIWAASGTSSRSGARCALMYEPQVGTFDPAFTSVYLGLTTNFAILFVP